MQQGFWNCPCVPMRERKVILYTLHPWDFMSREAAAPLAACCANAICSEATPSRRRYNAGQLQTLVTSPYPILPGP